ARRASAAAIARLRLALGRTRVALDLLRVDLDLAPVVVDVDVLVLVAAGLVPAAPLLAGGHRASVPRPVRRPAPLRRRGRRRGGRRDSASRARRAGGCPRRSRER